MKPDLQQGEVTRLKFGPPCMESCVCGIIIFHFDPSVQSLAVAPNLLDDVLIIIPI